MYNIIFYCRKNFLFLKYNAVFLAVSEWLSFPYTVLGNLLIKKTSTFAMFHLQYYFLVSLTQRKQLLCHNYDDQREDTIFG